MELFDKGTIHQILVKPVKLFGHPSIKDKIEAISKYRSFADTSDIKYVYPLIFSKNRELAIIAADTVAEIMRKVQDRHWNTVYDEVKYTKIDLGDMDIILNYPRNTSIHLLGIASLNCNGFVREKALRLINDSGNSCSIPYIILRLSDWVPSVRILAEQMIEKTLTRDYIDIFIDNFYLINKLQNVIRVDLLKIRQRIVDFLKNYSFRNIIMSRLKHSQVKVRLFCYSLLTERISYDEDIINCALKDKSFEVRIWLVNAIKTVEYDKRIIVIRKLLNDKSAKVIIAILRNYEEIVCREYRERLKELVIDQHVSVRDEARFITKKHSLIEDFREFYKQQLDINTVYGALMGLGETGEKGDFEYIRDYFNSEEPKIKLASMTAMWYLSKDEGISYVLKSLDSDIPKIKKTAKKIVINSKMPIVLYEMKEKLKSNNTEIRLLALDVIWGYGGWNALEGILFAISKWQSPEIAKAISLLGRWLIRATSLYTKPDNTTYYKISEYFEFVKRGKLISDEAIKELAFIFETRGLKTIPIDIF